MNKQIVLGTFLRGFTLSRHVTLKKRFDLLKQVAQEAELPAYAILILEQPRDYFAQCDRQQDHSEWVEAANALGDPLVFFYDFEYVYGEPATLPLTILHRHAFEDLAAEGFVYVDPTPPDWPEWTQYQRPLTEKLTALVRRVMTADYVIGDYNPVMSSALPYPQHATIKREIEVAVKQSALERFGPIVAGWDLFRDLQRPRSEFYAFSKKLYGILKEFEKTRFPIPYDYGLQMLLVARINSTLEIAREYIGDIPETGTYSEQKRKDQLRRVDFQLAQLHDWLSPLAAGLTKG